MREVEGKRKSVQHAIGVLDSVARESSAGVKEMIQKDIKEIRETFDEIKPEVKQALKEFQEVSVDGLMATAGNLVSRAKKTVSAHPWFFFGGAVAFAGLAGFLAGRSLDGRSKEKRTARKA